VSVRDARLRIVSGMRRFDPAYRQPVVAVRTLPIRQHLVVPNPGAVRYALVGLLGLASGIVGGYLASLA
jgi:hypothetical protein